MKVEKCHNCATIISLRKKSIFAKSVTKARHIYSGINTERRQIRVGIFFFFRAALSEHPFSYYVCVHKISRDSRITRREGCCRPKEERISMGGGKRTTIRLRGRVTPSSIPHRMKTAPHCASRTSKSRDTFARAPYPTPRITRKFSRDRAHELPHRSRSTRAGVLSGARKQILAYRVHGAGRPEALDKKARVAYFRSRHVRPVSLTPLFRIIS